MTTAATAVGPSITENGNIHQVKSLDPNRYATKKTIAQGMLDIALLTANASQLKYILQVGKQHEFYTLMLTLICISIGLQIAQGLICLLLGSSYNINKEKDHKTANIWNNVVLSMMMLTVTVNIIISVFEMHGDPASDNP
ncbi:ninjurin-1 isoform X1 [Microplitis demolitor]|uniref:ninjurin-1 isoform X1 n=1 Tax=Microplitis demolitor TaxID=69319 RepID=UPI0004CDCE42|nr:ninjurin-1 isoform X1 [Microplitis demolitor]